jgi:hypothetical protein
MHLVRSDVGAPTAAQLTTAQAAIRTVWENTAEWCPNEVTTSIPQTSDIIDAASGDLVRSLTASSAQTSVPGAYTGNWQNGVGTRIVWDTGIVANGRRVKGFTYLVPYGGIFDQDGTLSAAATSDINGVCTALLSALTTAGWMLVVYSYIQHSFIQITGGHVTDKAVILRSRRD